MGSSFSLSVPSTSKPLPLCYCYDVTGAKERASFPLPGGGKTGSALKDVGMTLLGYHNWPMGYMARHYQTHLDAQGRLVVPSHKKLRGDVYAERQGAQCGKTFTCAT